MNNLYEIEKIYKRSKSFHRAMVPLVYETLKNAVTRFLNNTDIEGLRAVLAAIIEYKRSIGEVPVEPAGTIKGFFPDEDLQFSEEVPNGR